MSYNRKTSGDPTAAGGVAAIATILVGLFLLVCAYGWVTGFMKADGGHVIVVRNGGPFDDNSIRQVIQSNSGVTSTGLWSTGHPYPSRQRSFKVSGAPNADSNEVITVPTKDGVLVGVEGTFYFDVNTDERALRAFDDRYGTRTYPTPDGHALAAWDGEAGWNAFLAFTLGNLVQNVLRQEIGNVECTDLVASCALARNSSAQTTAVPGGNGNQTISAVQDAVDKRFTSSVDLDLGVPVFIHPRFVLSKIDLPLNVQGAINHAQAAFAGVTESQAALQRAEIDSRANQQRQLGYALCPACAVIDELRALPPGITTFAPGAGFAITGK